ncbi:hypothetical protein HPB51_029313 [Rhipicephalus microplus]|uniref:Uncharacterized protein n=1 Tax=Rhipicephalus microplus TaxID=6941 RepID=A0A9J6CUF4_RHIMP|nr:hypothetical protein HPB51_029313 [Rhipicephalus microplus]
MLALPINCLICVTFPHMNVVSFVLRRANPCCITLEEAKNAGVLEEASASVAPPLANVHVVSSYYFVFPTDVAREECRTCQNKCYVLLLDWVLAEVQRVNKSYQAEYQDPMKLFEDLMILVKSTANKLIQLSCNFIESLWMPGHRRLLGTPEVAEPGLATEHLAPREPCLPTTLAMGKPGKKRTAEEEAAIREARRAADRERCRLRRLDPVYMASERIKKRQRWKDRSMLGEGARKTRNGSEISDN